MSFSRSFAKWKCGASYSEKHEKVPFKVPRLKHFPFSEHFLCSDACSIVSLNFTYKHKLKDKFIKNFKMVTAENYTQHRPCLSVAPVQLHESQAHKLGSEFSAPWVSLVWIEGGQQQRLAAIAVDMKLVPLTTVTEFSENHSWLLFVNAFYF